MCIFGLNNIFLGLPYCFWWDIYYLHEYDIIYDIYLYNNIIIYYDNLMPLLL